MATTAYVPPSEVQTGLGHVHGIADNGTRLTMSGYASFILDTAKAAHKFKMEAIEDEIGFDRALTATNAHTEVDIQWVPTGETRALAATSAVYLQPLAKVTLANFQVTAFNGDYVYIGDESIDLSHSHGKMNLKLRKYDDANQNASLTTTVQN